MNKLITFLLVTTAVAITPPVLADWPEKPIKITIPYRAGAGAVDQITRQLQKMVADNSLSKQPIVIFNIGGPVQIGMRQVKDQKPDGYNFLVVNTAIMTLEATGKIDFGYRDFQPVARIGQFCQTTSVSRNTGITTLNELLDRAVENPNTLVHGANLGAVNHIYGFMVEDLKPGAKFRFVQTGGDTGTFTELKGGRVQVAGFSAPGATKYALGADGKPDHKSPVRLLAYAGDARSPSLPSVPTFKELGYDLSFCVDEWYLAPKGTPKSAIDGFAAIVKKALAEESMQRFLKKRAMIGAFQTGQELSVEMDRQWKAIEAVAYRAGKQ